MAKTTRRVMRCPTCYSRVRFDGEDPDMDEETALELHRLSGRCRAVEGHPVKPPKAERHIIRDDLDW